MDDDTYYLLEHVAYLGDHPPLSLVHADVAWCPSCRGTHQLDAMPAGDLEHLKRHAWQTHPFAPDAKAARAASAPS